MPKLLISLLLRGAGGLSRLSEHTARKAANLTVTNGTTDTEVNAGPDGSTLVRVFRRYGGDRTLLVSAMIPGELPEEAIMHGVDVAERLIITTIPGARLHAQRYIEDPIPLEHR